MSDRRLRRVVDVLTVAFVPIWLVVVASDFSGWNTESVDQFILGQMVGVFFLVGVMILRRQPRHRIGWLFVVIGFYGEVGGLLDQSESVWADILWSWFVFLGLVLVFVPLWLPTGFPPTRRWRPVGWMGVTVLTVVTFLTTFREDVCERHDEVVSCVPNPIGLSGVPDPEYGPVANVVLGIFLVTLLCAVVSLLVRFRRSRGVERQQLKWIAFAFSLLVGWILVVDIVVVELTEIQPGFPLTTIPMLLFLFLPVSIGIAILRYRLYDIDLVINRALVYLTLTGFLALVYTGGVVGLSQLLPVADNDLAVAASTLAVAALFSPARRRIQSFVDRRFYRQRYDTRKLVEEMSARISATGDLDALARGVQELVQQSLQPARLGLWTRGGTP